MNDLPQDKQKPNALGLEVIKESIPSNKIFYLGDTPDDIICAKNANVIAIGILPPQDKTENLVNLMKQKGADFVIKNVNEIQKIMEISTNEN